MSESKPTEKSSAFGHTKPLDPFASLVYTPQPPSPLWGLGLNAQAGGQLGGGGGGASDPDACSAAAAAVSSARRYHVIIGDSLSSGGTSERSGPRAVSRWRCLDLAQSWPRRGGSEELRVALALRAINGRAADRSAAARGRAAAASKNV